MFLSVNLWSTSLLLSCKIFWLILSIFPCLDNYLHPTWSNFLCKWSHSFSILNGYWKYLCVYTVSHFKRIWKGDFFLKPKMYAIIEENIQKSVPRIDGLVHVNAIQKDPLSFSWNMWLSSWMCFLSKLGTGLGGDGGEQVKVKEQNGVGGCFEDESERRGNCLVR